MYDDAGRVKTTISLDERGYEWPTSYAYDDAGKQTAVIDPCGHTIAYNYDSGLGVYRVDINSLGFNGTHMTVTHYQGTRRDYVTDACDNTTYFTYDTLGRVIKTTYPSVQYVNSSGQTVTSNLYTHIGYDGLGRKAYQSEQTPKADAGVNGGNLDAGDGVRRFDYDSAGRLVRVTLPQVPDPCNNNAMTNPLYDYIYDKYGNQVGIIDALGRLTAFKYDEQNRQTRKYMPFVVANLGAIDTAAEVYASIPANQPCEIRTYDDLGRLVTVTDFGGVLTVFSYDARGFVEYESHYSVGAYNPANPTYNANPDIYNVYDNLGRRQSVTVTVYNGSGGVVETNETGYTYDAEGHVIDISNPQGVIAYDYNNVTSHIESVKTPSDGSDTKIAYKYDVLGRLGQVIVNKRNGYTPSNETATYGYNPVGSRASLKYANGNFTQYTYDALNRLTNLTNYQTDQKTTTLSSFSYTHYADGMRRQLQENIGENRDNYIRVR